MANIYLKFPLRAWLRSFEREKYFAVFEEHGLVSYRKCLELNDEEDLKRIGITEPSDVQDILLEVDRLKCNSEDYAIRMLLHEPLYRACEKGDLVKVRWLIDEGADVNWRNKKERERTCLHITAKNGRTKILNYLVNRPDVITEICDADGNTAAHYSARYGHLGGIKILHQCDEALFLLENKYHRIPLEEADHYRQMAVVDYLDDSEECSSVSEMSVELNDCEDSPRLGDNKPTLLDLTRMKGADGKALHVIKTIAAGDFETFGMFLLQDDNKMEVDLIKKSHIQEGPEIVTQKIIQKWLSSDASTLTYQHLIESLKDAGLGALAQKITSVQAV